MKRSQALIALVAAVVAAAATYAGMSATDSPSRPVSAAVTAPPSIPSNCSTDATSALQHWLSGVPDGRTARLAAGGCYQVDGHLLLTGRHDLTLDGNGATLKVVASPAASAPTLEFDGGSDVRVSDLNVLGDNPSPTYVSSRQWDTGIRLDGVDGATITGVTIDHVHGDFVEIAGLKGKSSRDIRISDCQFDTSGRQGISFGDANGVVVDDVRLGNVPNDTYDVETDGPQLGVTGLTIENTTSFGRGQVWLSVGGAADVATGQLTVVDNVMTSAQAGTVIDLWAPPGHVRSSFMFRGNTLFAGSSSLAAAVQMTRVSDVTFEDNTVTFGNYGKGSGYTHELAFRAFDSTGVSLSGNTLDGPGTPLLSQSGSQVDVRANTVNQ